MGTSSWIELVEDCDPQLMDSHVNHIANRLALEMSEKRHFSRVAIQGLITILYAEITVRRTWMYHYYESEFGADITLQDSIAKKSMELATTLYYTFNTELICLQ